jgi:hypothetical protein
MSAPLPDKIEAARLAYANACEDMGQAHASGTGDEWGLAAHKEVEARDALNAAIESALSASEARAKELERRLEGEIGMRDFENACCASDAPPHDKCCNEEEYGECRACLRKRANAMEAEAGRWKQTALTIQTNLAESHKDECHREWLRGHTEAFDDAATAYEEKLAEATQRLDGYSAMCAEQEARAAAAEARREEAERDAESAATDYTRLVREHREARERVDFLEAAVRANEDKRLRALSDLEVSESRAEALEKALREVLDSAVPHPVEHPTMTRAWDRARRALSGAGAEEGRDA